jgi:hypothetical protein
MKNGLLKKWEQEIIDELKRKVHIGAFFCERLLTPIDFNTQTRTEIFNALRQRPIP